MMPRSVVDAKADKEGDITHVKLDGNPNFTSVEKATQLAGRGEIGNAHTVRRKNAKPHLRTNHEKKKSNNLDDTAGDK